jgi:hypothetical protein
MRRLSELERFWSPLVLLQHILGDLKLELVSSQLDLVLGDPGLIPSLLRVAGENCRSGLWLLQPARKLRRRISVVLVRRLLLADGCLVPLYVSACGVGGGLVAGEDTGGEAVQPVSARQLTKATPAAHRHDPTMPDSVA